MTTQNHAPVDNESAFNLVNTEVYVPVFFTKLANDYGIRPRNAAEVEQMLSMSAQLREQAELEEKQAAAAGNPLLNSAQQHLNSVLEARGARVSGFNDSIIKKAAAEKAVDPNIAHAILTLHLNAAAGAT